jgi:glutathione S-transferase
VSDFTLYLGYRNYSSWSLRAWLAMRRTGAPFDENVYDLSRPEVREEIRRVSPTGKVPALRHADLVVWDSLAIGEYLAERFPDAGLWPSDPEPRAVARAVCAEMHSGFQALRQHMPMNIRRAAPGMGRAPGVQDDIDRIQALWRSCHARFGGKGDFLFGPLTLADAFFAPVVTRFTTYAVEVDAASRAYMDAVLADPDVRSWCEAARAETWVNPAYEV